MRHSTCALNRQRHERVTKMATMPETSTTLLRDVAAADHPRWGEFVARYRPALEAFATERFPGLEADDLIQETFIAVARALPDYRHVPEEKGHFRSYLTGILHHKCLNAVRSAKRKENLVRKYAAEARVAGTSAADPQRRLRETVYEIALQQLMANPDIADRTKRIFERTAIKGEKPEDVAASLVVSRDVVDQAKKRMMERLRGIIEKLKGAYGV